MAEIVNLRRARKDKARRERESEADANRRRFGRTKAEKPPTRTPRRARAGRSTASGSSPKRKTELG